MIREVEKIPDVQLPPSIKGSIRKDLQEAVDNHIEHFEFVGYDGKKHLAQYAREVAERFTMDYFRPLLKEVAEKNGWNHLGLPLDYKRNHFIKIEKRGDKVYCTINYSCVSKIVNKAEKFEIKCIDEQAIKQKKKARRWQYDET